MDELRDLLELWENEESRRDMTAEQLARLDELLGERAVELAGDDENPPTQAALDELATVVETTEAVRAESEAREAAADEARGKATELLNRIRSADDDDGGEPVDETPVDETPVDDTPDPEVVPVEEVEIVAVDTPADEPVPVAAKPSTRIGRVAARRPQSMQPQPRKSESLSLVASANVTDSGIRAGQSLDDPADLAQAFLAAYESSAGYQGPRVKIPVAMAGSRRVDDIYPRERILGRDQSVNEERINAVTSQRAITAAGGRCVPSPTLYDIPTMMGTDARPVRDDMLVRFGADRGGVNTMAPMVLSDMDAAIGQWTMANDLNPTNPTTKPCLTVECVDDNESLVYALTKCLQFGNFRARFFGEQIQAAMDLAAVNHARTAESLMLKAVGDGSTKVTVGTLLDAVRDLLAGLDRATAQMRNRHRLPRSFPLHWGAPEALLNLIRAGLARQMPVGTLDETLAVADAQIEAWFRAIGLNVTWFLDGEAGQIYGAQGDGPLNGWISTVVTYLYPEGSWLALDGGQLDLGIVRDSDLNSTNDFQVFAETFEGVHFHGVESERITFDICPDGSAAALVDISPCDTGS